MGQHTTIRRRPLPERNELFSQLHPVLARVLAARNISSVEAMDHSLGRLLPPDALMGIGQAVALLQTALHENWRILFVGDYDADGATSCAVGVRALRAMGASQVSCLVPNRMEDGYGLTPQIVEVAARQSPDLIVTVDNGISSIDGVAAARAQGMRVLVTDHHLPGEQLPAADAVVNPNQSGDRFPSKALAGVGVIFYVMLALRSALREVGWFGGPRPEPNLAELLDLVALGTIADVVPLDQNNRILVAQGLARIQAGRACPGIAALARVAGRDSTRLRASDLGFFIGPRLNAAGRLEDMSCGVACLLAEDDASAEILARQLDTINRERQAIQSDMQEAADTIVGRLSEAESLPHGLCIFEPEWHQGVVGLVASRLKEALHRPVIAFAPGQGDELRGSARSIPGFHVRDALEAVSTRYPGLVRKFGGHAMAAGLSLGREDYQRFSTAFDEEVQRHLSEEDFRGVILSDGELPASDLSMDLAEVLAASGPWGQAFPEPVFDGVFDVLSRRVVGGVHLKLTLQPAGSRQAIDAIAFRHAPDGIAPDWPQVRAAYKLDINEFNGRRSLQCLVEHLEPHE